MSYLKSYNLLTKILIVFIVASCGGGKAPFALTLPDISNLTLDEDNESEKTDERLQSWSRLIMKEAII